MQQCVLFVLKLSKELLHAARGSKRFANFSIRDLHSAFVGQIKVDAQIPGSASHAKVEPGLLQMLSRPIFQVSRANHAGRFGGNHKSADAELLY